MNDDAVPVLALVLALLVSTLAVPLPVGGVPDARLTVSGVAVTPETPVTDAPVTADVTVQLAAGSPSPVELRDLFLADADGDRLVSATNVGALSPGGSVTIPLTTAFEEPGRKDLQVVVVGENDTGGEVRVTRPLTVVVEQAPPQVSLRPGRGVAGVERGVEVEIANPTTSPLRNIAVTVAGEGSEERRAIATLAAGATETLNVSLTPGEAGERPVTATVEYTTARGTRATTNATGTLSVDPLREDVGVRVERVDAQQAATGDLGGQLGSLIGGGGAAATQQSGDEESRGDRVSVTVTNFGNAPVRETVLAAQVDGETRARYGVGTLVPGASESVTVDLSTVGGGPVRFAVTYAVADRQGTAGTTYDYRAPNASLAVTGVNLTLEDGVLRITGNAGNTGRADVTGVVVSVGENEFVSPAYPQRDYFVGTVEGSEFAPFEVTARVDADNATSVPLQVRYTVGDEERVETVELPYDERLRSEPEGESFPLGLLGGAVVALGAAVALVVAATRYR
ncbi:hypothetical protein [Halomarina litorea]|uniref:hypothetical protein n=1 Tax=Halomarina litorea TaxID=2961595 RepID=UPI0020C45129|nr:hypothetical protein [Halomarina sp. BCD28]